jgi:uncharacterized protein
MLAQIARGESFLRSLGFKELRVRHHGKSARLEIKREDFLKMTSPEVIKAVGKQLHTLGFSSVMLDIEGYRSGVFNEGLQKG